jgi:hypothetical protein
MDRDVDEMLAVSNTADSMTQQACAMACRCIDKHLVYRVTGNGKRGKTTTHATHTGPTAYIMRHKSSRPNNLLPEGTHQPHAHSSYAGDDTPRKLTNMQPTWANTPKYAPPGWVEKVITS